MDDLTKIILTELRIKNNQPLGDILNKRKIVLDEEQQKGVLETIKPFVIVTNGQRWNNVLNIQEGGLKKLEILETPPPLTNIVNSKTINVSHSKTGDIIQGENVGIATDKEKKWYQKPLFVAIVVVILTAVVSIIVWQLRLARE